MNNINPKVSIITITYNLIEDGRIELFRKCMESVHEQTYQNIEHIIIDGASSDGSMDIIQEYVTKGWCICYSEKDKGVDDAYNKGTLRATGDFIAWLNSDDQYYDKNTIQKCIDKILSNDADYCYGKVQLISRDNIKKGEFVPKVENFWKCIPFSHQSLILRKSILEDLGGYNTDYKIGGDYFLILQLILNDYKGVNIDSYICKYYLGGFSGDWTNRYKQYYCAIIFSKRLNWLFKQFYENSNEDLALDIFLHGEDYRVYPKYFLLKLTRFMIEKNLKNFDYNSFMTYIEKLMNPVFDYNTDKLLTAINDTYQYNIQKKQREVVSTLYLFNFIPICRIKFDPTKSFYRLFNIIPILKIKKGQIK